MCFRAPVKLLTLCAAAFFIVLPLRVDAADERPLNLLFFGNSFTILPGSSAGQRVPDNISQLAVADGHLAPLIVADLEGSTELDRHITRVQNQPQFNVNHPSIAGKTWDYVIAQGHSRESSHAGDPLDFIADARTLHTLIHDHASGRGAGMQTILYQTWAYAAPHSIYPGTFANPTQMHNEIRSNYALAAQGINAVAGAGSAHVAPAGDAFAALDFAHGPSPALDLYTSDHYHSSLAGALLASMVIYRTIYNEDVSDIAYPGSGSWAGVNLATWNTLAATADAIPVPEPATGLLLLGGMSAALVRRPRVRR